ncbi:MAG: transcriptional regulator [Chlorobi bacterium]|nr:transcriptional regulator [Chlorobiota bacterium]
MPENQNIEWKESWRDEYLKWICGFANAIGGKIYIGKNDKGENVGINNPKKLMEDIPNKILSHLGILCDVNLQGNGDCYIIEISVDAYSNPINYKGHYHYRSGSTMQELKGAALNKFLLRKQGQSWDSVPVPNISVDDLDKNAFNVFRKKSFRSGRIDEEVLQDSNLSLLENLDLVEGAYLKRACVLLFHSKQEKFFLGSYVKIGFFESDDDLRYQDEVHGHLFNQIEKTLDLLKTKYLKAFIRYEGASRIEEFVFPEPAFREALLNAIAHKDYSSTTPIQIRVYEDKLIIWNEGQLPDEWTIENLIEPHPSKPFNPLIANALFRVGYIEAWGRGTINIRKECRKYHLPAPKFNSRFSGLVVEFYKHTVNSLKSLGLNDSYITIVLFVQEKGKITNTEVQDICKVSKRTASRYLLELEDLFFKKKGETGKGTFYTLKGP